MDPFWAFKMLHVSPRCRDFSKEIKMLFLPSISIQPLMEADLKSGDVWTRLSYEEVVKESSNWDDQIRLYAAHMNKPGALSSPVNHVT